MMLEKEFEPALTLLVNEISLCNDLLNSYRKILNEKLNVLQHDLSKIQLYLRFKVKFVTYHSVLYSKRFSCNNYLVSYRDNYNQTQYGNIILFYSFENVYYTLIQQYHQAAVHISDDLKIPDEFKNIVDSFYPICYLSNEFIVIQVSDIVSKCVSVPFQQYKCISERRVNY